MNIPWLKTIPVAVTVTDLSGKIIEMNDKSAEVFKNYGGYDLLGKELNNCHNPHSREIIASMLANDTTNAYTIEKNGIRKMIFQAPWHQDGKPAGLAELSFEIPEQLPHFKR